MSTTDMAYDMTDSQTTQAHVRQIFASCHVLKSVSCQLQPFKTSRSKPKRRSSPAMPLLRRCVVFMALVVAMPPEGGPAAPPGGPSAPPGPSACPGSGGPAPPPGGGPGADPATLNALAGLWSFLARPPPPALATGGVAATTAKAAPPNAPGTSMPPPGTVPVTRSGGWCRRGWASIVVEASPYGATDGGSSRRPSGLQSLRQANLCWTWRLLLQAMRASSLNFWL